MSSIHNQGEGSFKITPEDKQLYRKEYRQGLDLFQRALDEYEKAEEIHKKDAFRKVMDRALIVLNETARELKRPDLMNCNDKLSEDFSAYQKHPDEQVEKALRKDIQNAKRNIG